MSVASDVCVSLGVLTIGELEDWGNSKQEVRDLMQEKSFQEYISEICASVGTYYQEKRTQISGIQEEEGKQIIEGKIRQDIILSLAEENAIASFTGKSWNDIATITLENRKWLRDKMGETVKRIIGLVDGRISLAKVDRKNGENLNIGISDCWLVAPKIRKIEIGIYPIEKLRQWAESKEEFVKAVRDCEFKTAIRDRRNGLGKVCEDNSIPIYFFEDLETVDSLEQKITERTVQKLAEAQAIASITGESWKSVANRTILDKKWLDEQINCSCDFWLERIKDKIKERRRAHLPDYDCELEDGEVTDDSDTNYLNL